MKRIIIALFVLMLALTGCNTKTNDDILDIAEVESFETFISQTPQPLDIKKGLDKRIEKSGIKTADALVIEYLDYMAGLVWEGVPNMEESEAFTEAGFKFIEIEGFGVSTIDYHFLEQYNDKVSSGVKDFAALMSLSSDKPWAMDAGIVIPLEDLAHRIALSEEYISAYPLSPLTEKVAEQYQFYLSGFLRGLDNTPLVDHSTNKVNPQFIAAFDHFILTYPDLITTETVKIFLQELESGNYIAPYRYSEYEKRVAFIDHVDDLVKTTLEKL